MFKKNLKLEEYSPKTEIEKSAVELIGVLSIYSESFFVGGYPRDLLFYKFLNKKNQVKDIDIAISNNKKKDFKDFLDANNIEYKTLSESLKVYLVKFNNFEFQVAVLRKDGKSSDGSKPKSAKFLKSIKKDSIRRDFTINALYFNPITKTISDFHKGIKDIKKEKIRFIGNPEKRIKEDYLRILRYIRFKNKYNLKTIDKDLLLLKKHSKNLEKVSKERLKMELDNVFYLNNIDGIFYEFDKFKVLDVLLPEIKKTQGVTYKIHDQVNPDIYTFTVNCLKNFSNKIFFNLLKKYLKEDFLELQGYRDVKDFIIEKYGLGIFWTCLFNGLGKMEPRHIDLDDGSQKIIFENHENITISMSMEIMKRYNFSKELKEEISWMIINHDIKVKEVLSLDLEARNKIFSNDNFIKIIILNIIFLVSEYNSEEAIDNEFDKNFGNILNIYKKINKKK